VVTHPWRLQARELSVTLRPSPGPSPAARRRRPARLRPAGARPRSSSPSARPRRGRPVAGGRPVPAPACSPAAAPAAGDRRPDGSVRRGRTGAATRDRAGDRGARSSARRRAWLPAGAPGAGGKRPDGSGRRRTGDLGCRARARRRSRRSWTWPNAIELVRVPGLPHHYFPANASPPLQHLVEGKQWQGSRRQFGSAPSPGGPSQAIERLGQREGWSGQRLTQAPAFSWKTEAGRMYLRTMRSERWPVWRMIARSGALAAPAAVAKPLRRLWPA